MLDRDPTNHQSIFVITANGESVPVRLQGSFSRHWTPTGTGTTPQGLFITSFSNKFPQSQSGPTQLTHYYYIILSKTSPLRI